MREISIHWFRRDLRLHDNAALHHALKNDLPVLCLFILDSNILKSLEDKSDHRVSFIHRRLTEINSELEKHGSGLLVKYGTPHEIFTELTAAYKIKHVYANEDYEPYARERDNKISRFLESNQCRLHLFKDHVIFSKDDVVKYNGAPYTVYTPYMKKWKAKLPSGEFLKSYPSKLKGNLFKLSIDKIPSLKETGFDPANRTFPYPKLSASVLKDYAQTRDYPALDATTYLGMHLRFGALSIREVVRHAIKHSETWLNEIIWREFFIQILWHFPRVVVQAFKKEYERLEWSHNEHEFEKWCTGNTGYPIVDAGMRQLNETGFMHNRVRMLTACFLTKYLLIDWRWGEAYFAQKLSDYELASNNGNWQWSAGTGCDAAPYFRVFNMSTQTKKFDPDLTYIKKWVPEFESSDYPKPMIDYEFARKRCLGHYGDKLKVKS